jgi:hypothetical protein
VNDVHVFTGSPIPQLAMCALAALTLHACSSPPAPSAPAATVDVLNYLLGEASLWPRVGSHAQHQVVDLARREVCWVKYANPRRYECWRWDDEFVYHATDHALDGDSDESYRFSDGRWLPRHLPAHATAAAPWTLEVARNDLVWYDASCRVDPSRSHLFPYRMRAWTAPRVDAGRDLGVRDALVFEYEPYDPAVATAAAPERFTMALGAGWFRWERGGFIDLFDRLGGPIVQMNATVRCDR